METGERCNKAVFETFTKILIAFEKMRAYPMFTDAGFEIAGCQWPKPGHILEIAGENKTGLPN